ncbi:hypothetical protein DSLASN_26890 [Desulfoluna limicola]|uniref:N-acetyltransferase domain-containing protein n=1 Tax=Desulfoluna limicola TaxID=2810562 RepID=A0ABM7PHK1_9BACT|nr:hypothetical protein [Desulfoluna limicola]BCS97057.1 hypothetical protein DSLASN_26890 [Desulfoluna limicola]
MKSYRRIPYRLFCATRKTPLCDVVLSFSAPSCSHGRVTITTTYPDPLSPGTVRRHAQSQSWFKNNQGELLMCVGRFSLPDALKRRGIGSWIWSMIHRHLPEPVRNRLILKGSLSSTDAFVPKTDSEGRPVLGSEGPELMNQVALRNRFWNRMLAPVTMGKPALWCDDKGNGAFCGLFRNPAPTPSPRHILVECMECPLQTSA